jgi:GWxTD domain-containing protein
MFNQRLSFSLAVAIAVAAFSSVGVSQAQTPAATGEPAAAGGKAAQTGSPAGSQATSQSADPSDSPDFDATKRKISDREAYKRQKEYHEEIKGAYKSWLNNDVHWIITDQEAKAFKSLSNDEERDAFIENFWLRRNPNPDSPENEFREEHYRRIAYANEHFAAGKPGWKTDRGHIYIAYGKPDSMETHPSGGSYDRPMEEGGGQTSTFPFETWHYRYIEGIGDNIDIEFVDTCMCGDYHMTIDRSEKDALLHVPGAGQTLYEQMGRASKADRFKGGLESLGTGPDSSSQQSKQFDRIELMAKLQAPPVIKFKDLELESFMSKSKLITGPIFPFDVRVDYVKVTDDTVLVPITLQIRNRDITFNTKDGVAKGVVNIIGRVATITGKISQTFEDTVEVEVPADLLAKTMDNQSVYWKALPLRPGRYRVDIGIKDVNNPDHVGIFGQGIMVPRYDDEKLAASSLILADKMEPVPTKQIGSGSFVIGNTYVRPRVAANPATPVSFHRNQRLNFWMQVYNLGIDDKSKTNSATIDYQITDASNKMVFEKQEDSKTVSANSDQMTLEKSWSLAQLTPGKYRVTIKINDSVSKQEIAQSVPFVVE